jgi:histidinol-phosphatase
MSAQPCRVSDINALRDASVSYSSLAAWEDAGRGEDFVALLRSCWRTRAYGDFWSYMLVAEGAVDIALEPQLALYDMAALAVIVDEAGGRFSGLDDLAGPNSGNALATNGRLHDQVLAFVGSSPDPEPPGRQSHEGSVHDLSAHRQRLSPESPPQ